MRPIVRHVHLHNPAQTPHIELSSRTFVEVVVLGIGKLAWQSPAALGFTDGESAGVASGMRRSFSTS